MYSRDEILSWYKGYDDDYPERDRQIEEELGNKLRLSKELTKDDLIKIIEWKFQDRTKGRRKIILRLLKDIDDSEIRRVVNVALNTENETLRIKKLRDGITGVGFALASVILTFYAPKNYGVFDIHVYDELFGTNPKTRPKNLFGNCKYYLKFLRKLREIAKKHDLDVRAVEKALFKKNVVTSQRCLAARRAFDSRTTEGKKI